MDCVMRLGGGGNVLANVPDNILYLFLANGEYWKKTFIGLATFSSAWPFDVVQGGGLTTCFVIVRT